MGLDYKFEGDLPSPRLMLHCRELRVPLQQGLVEAVSPTSLEDHLEVVDGGEVSNSEYALADEQVDGLTRQQDAPNSWQSFAGGLSEHILDDTHWDMPMKLRTTWSTIRTRGPRYTHCKVRG